MKLTKWYLDFVSDDGVAALCYSAKLSYHDLSLGYSALVTGQYNGEFKAQYSLQNPMPEITADVLHWQAAKSATAFSWQTTGMSASQPLALWQTEEGGVVWHNLIPGAQAQMHHDHQLTFGRGYVEQLSLDIPPWKLPIKRLRWGRFVGSQLTLVWIQWHLRDGSTKQWLTLNQQAVEHFSLSDQRVSCAAGRLQIGPGSPIRQGFLRDTAFSGTAFLQRFLPKAVLDIHEHKQLAPAAFYSDGQATLDGWVIDEVVEFP